MADAEREREREEVLATFYLENVLLFKEKSFVLQERHL